MDTIRVYGPRGLKNRIVTWFNTGSDVVLQTPTRDETTHAGPTSSARQTRGVGDRVIHTCPPRSNAIHPSYQHRANDYVTGHLGKVLVSSVSVYSSNLKVLLTVSTERSFPRPAGLGQFPQTGSSCEINNDISRRVFWGQMKVLD